MSVAITFFAHATTYDNENGISSGQADAQVSELGLRQINGLRKTVASHKFDAVYCSDLIRAKTTAEGVFSGVPIVIRRDLREIDIGSLTGKEDKYTEPLMLGFIDQPYPNGESFNRVGQRVQKVLEEIRSKYDGRRIAIVGHQATQFALEVLLNGKSWQQAINSDWRKTISWQPGWEYDLK